MRYLLTMVLLAASVQVATRTATGQALPDAVVGIASVGPDEMLDGATLVINGDRIKICGIQDTQNEASAAQLVALVDGKQVSCRLVGDGTPCDGRTPTRFYDSFQGQCFVDGDDVAALMVDSGAARDLPFISGGHYAR